MNKYCRNNPGGGGPQTSPIFSFSSLAWWCFSQFLFNSFLAFLAFNRACFWTVSFQIFFSSFSLFFCDFSSINFIVSGLVSSRFGGLFTFSLCSLDLHLCGKGLRSSKEIILFTGKQIQQIFQALNPLFLKEIQGKGKQASHVFYLHTGIENTNVSEASSFKWAKIYKSLTNFW